MSKEIEKKYLLRENGLVYSRDGFLDRSKYLGQRINQGYLEITLLEELCDNIHDRPDFDPVEIRLRKKENTFYLTFKGEGNLERDEKDIITSSKFFYRYWPKTLGKRIDKIRIKRPYGDFVLEIDFYQDRDLIIAEIELPNAELASIISPIGRDVTENKRYKNKNLAK